MGNVGRRPAALATVIAFVAALAMTAGCSQGDGDVQAGSVEKPALTLAVPPTWEALPFSLDMTTKLLTAEGLTLMVQVTDEQAALAGIATGAYDIALTNYVPALQAAANSVVDVQIVADFAYAAPGTTKLVRGKNSPVNSVEELAGARIAVPGMNSTVTLLLKDMMAGIPRIRWVEMPYPEMAAALSSGSVAAAAMLEPYATMAGLSTGAAPVADLADGPRSDFPLSALVASGAFVKDHPHTVAAFQRVTSSVGTAVTDRDVIEPALTNIEGMEGLGALLSLNFPPVHTDVTPVHVQRVTELMRRQGLLSERFDTTTLTAGAR